jgi:hypothetical protein
MEKYLKMTYVLSESGEEEERTILLEGDHRQTRDRMLEQFLVRTLGEDFKRDEDDNEYTAHERSVLIESVKRVPNSEVDSEKSSTFTLVVNENVTEPACGVSYSGPVPHST